MKYKFEVESSIDVEPHIPGHQSNRVHTGDRSSQSQTLRDINGHSLANFNYQHRILWSVLCCRVNRNPDKIPFQLRGLILAHSTLSLATEFQTSREMKLLRPSSYTTSAVPVLITVPVTGTVTCYAHVAVHLILSCLLFFGLDLTGNSKMTQLYSSRLSVDE